MRTRHESTVRVGTWGEEDRRPVNFTGASFVLLGHAGTPDQSRGRSFLQVIRGTRSVQHLATGQAIPPVHHYFLVPQLRGDPFGLHFACWRLLTPRWCRILADDLAGGARSTSKGRFSAITPGPFAPCASARRKGQVQMRVALKFPAPRSMGAARIRAGSHQDQFRRSSR